MESESHGGHVLPEQRCTTGTHILCLCLEPSPEHLEHCGEPDCRCVNVLCLCLEPSPEPEDLEQPGETVPLSDQTLPERLCLHRTALPAQVTALVFGGVLWGFRMTSPGVFLCFRQEADGKLYVRYQVLGRNHVAVPTHFFKVGSPVR